MEQKNFIPLSNILLNNDNCENFIITKEYKLNNEKIKKYSKIDKKPLRIGTVNKGGQGDRIYSTNGHAITLSAEGGGTGSKTGLYLVDEKVRKLHPRETARLMEFPDSFKYDSSINQAHKQFGNSVIVDILQLIIKELIKDGSIYNE